MLAGILFFFFLNVQFTRKRDTTFNFDSVNKQDQEMHSRALNYVLYCGFL